MLKAKSLSSIHFVGSADSYCCCHVVDYPLYSTEGLPTVGWEVFTCIVYCTTKLPPSGYDMLGHNVAFPHFLVIRAVMTLVVV